MEKEQLQEAAAKIHILVFPQPFQGHINPMLQFSKRLASSKGVSVTIVTTISASKSLKLQLQEPQAQAISSNLKVEHISDGSEHVQKSETVAEFFERFRKITTQTLAKLITNIKNNTSSSNPAVVKFLVYDSLMPWALDVAQQQGIDGAPFFTQSCALTAIYHHVHEGVLKFPLEEGPTATILMPSLPVPVGTNDVPSFLHDIGSPLYPTILNLMVNQFSNFRQVKWLFFNSFDHLEDKVVKWMRSQDWPVKTIGPTISSKHMMIDYSLSIFKPHVEITCIKWLDSKETGSVVYVSFGSVAILVKEQMEELAWVLKNMNLHFLWVVRESEREKLPNNFVEDMISADEKGLVVSWCHQLQVLAHKAVGCFVTHCGWNSTLEGLSLGVPMVAMPQQADQSMNAKFVVNVWGIGVRVKVDDDKGVATKEEIAMCIRQVMEEEKGMGIRKASSRWKELAEVAINEGGSSQNNIEEILAKLVLI